MDELEFIDLLPKSSFVSKSDRYNAFRRVFMGSPEGQQVLKEVLSWGHLFDIPINASPIDQIALNISTGERNIALKLLYVVNNEPPEPPKTTTRRSK